MGYRDWSQIADDNAAVDPTINALDAAPAKDYIPALRGVMAGVADLREDFAYAYTVNLMTDPAVQKAFLISLRANLPTSPDGLSPGDPWLNGGTISFVPNP